MQFLKGLTRWFHFGPPTTIASGEVLQDKPAQPQQLVTRRNPSKRPDFRIVCDDCWQKIKPEDHPEKYAKALAELKQQ